MWRLRAAGLNLSSAAASPPQAAMKIARSHYLPRTRGGWTCTVAFLFFMLLAEPPIVHGLMNRIEPWILGMPFLFVWLLVVYLAGIAVLIRAQRSRL